MRPPPAPRLTGERMYHVAVVRPKIGGTVSARSLREAAAAHGRVVTTERAPTHRLDPEEVATLRRAPARSASFGVARSFGDVHPAPLARLLG